MREPYLLGKMNMAKNIFFCFLYVFISISISIDIDIDIYISRDRDRDKRIGDRETKI